MFVGYCDQHIRHLSRQHGHRTERLLPSVVDDHAGGHVDGIRGHGRLSRTVRHLRVTLAHPRGMIQRPRPTARPSRGRRRPKPATPAEDDGCRRKPQARGTAPPVPDPGCAAQTRRTMPTSRTDTKNKNRYGWSLTCTAISEFIDTGRRRPLCPLCRTLLVLPRAPPCPVSVTAGQPSQQDEFTDHDRSPHGSGRRGTPQKPRCARQTAAEPAVGPPEARQAPTRFTLPGPSCARSSARSTEGR